MVSINRWTEEINKMRNGIIAWSMGINNDDVGSSFFQRNKTKIYTLLLFKLMGIVFYLIGLVTLARICLIVLILQYLSFGWNLFKGK